MTRIFLKIFRNLSNLQFQITSLRQIADVNSITFSSHLQLIEFVQAQTNEIRTQIEDLKTKMQLRDLENDELRQKIEDLQKKVGHSG